VFTVIVYKKSRHKCSSYIENYFDYNWFGIYSEWTYYIANGVSNFSSWPYGYFIPYGQEEKFETPLAM